MKLSDFSYDLPLESIAQYPLADRDQAKLLVIDRKKETISHDVFNRIDHYLPAQAMLVANESKVIPARLLGRREKTDGEVEVFVLKCVSEEDGLYEALLRPLKRLNVGEKIRIDSSPLIVELIDKDKRLVKFNQKDVVQALEKWGHIPLPPYINRQDERSDRVEYQTIFAKNPGSVASPTAGLHFTEALLEKLDKKGFGFEKVTLHINYGTFKPVEEDDITQHKMHTEDYSVSSSSYKNILEAKKQGRNIVCVGTTSCRVLETIAQTKKIEGSTNIFMYPGFHFQMTDALITNFHLPFSTLLMLVCAFGGRELILKSYQEAIRLKYRFYSYGDAMLII
jgi:S-adenosylmethionine:tRNA ribosyltransferase-isomerase